MTADNYLTTLAKQTAVLKAAAEDEIGKQMHAIFDQYPALKSVSILNSVTYNDEGYDWPSRRGASYGRGWSLIILNDEDDYDRERDDELIYEYGAISTFKTQHEKHFNLLFGAWDELRFERRRGKVEVHVYERER